MNLSIERIHYQDSVRPESVWFDYHDEIRSEFTVVWLPRQSMTRVSSGFIVTTKSHRSLQLFDYQDKVRPKSAVG